MTLESTALSGSVFSAPGNTDDILTTRLELIAITPETLQADRTKSPAFSQLIAADVPAEWPPSDWDDHAFDYLNDKFTRYPDSRGWIRYIAVKSDGNPRLLVGSCGATLPIETSDDIEIGYGLLPSFQRLGYGSEAVAALMEWIFQFPHVRSVNAQTFPHLEPSIRLLTRLGFQPAGPGPGPEEGTILFRKFRE